MVVVGEIPGGTGETPDAVGDENSPVRRYEKLFSPIPTTD
jgi:hypothetical protein